MVYIATAKIGAISCPFPIQYDRHELIQMGTVAQLRAFVTVTRAQKSRPASRALELTGPISSLTAVLAWGNDPPQGVIGLDKSMADTTGDDEYRCYLDSLDVDPNDCVTLCWTSGTEGVPKGVPRTHGDWQAVGLGTIETPRLTSDDVLLNPFPMVNAGGMAGMFMPWLMLGARLVQHHPFDIDVFIEQIETEKVTYTCAPPSVLNSLVESPDVLAGHDVRSLRAVGSGSAPLAGWMIEAWERGRGVEVLNLLDRTKGWSCTPARTPFPIQRTGADSSRARVIRASTGARESVAMRVRAWSILRPATTSPSLAGPASYECRLPRYSPVTGGPSRRRSTSSASTDRVTSSRLRVRGDIELVYVDRAKDLISRGGYKISAVEVESLLSAHPKVREVAVVGMPDERLGERLCAFVVASDPEDPPSLARAEMMMLDARLRLAKCRELLDVGVTIFYPHTCVIDSDVEVGADTVIEPFVQLLGSTRIGGDCRIRSYSVIGNSVLGDGVTFRPGTIMEDSRIGAGAVLGPISDLRPGSEVGEGAMWGTSSRPRKSSWARDRRRIT